MRNLGKTSSEKDILGILRVREWKGMRSVILNKCGGGEVGNGR